jgi:copper chaperone CopZ
MTEPVAFRVEQAGCESCASRVRAALAGLVMVEEITVDEDADEAAVRAHAPEGLDVATVDDALRDASGGSGHTYRVSPGSWRSGT